MAHLALTIGLVLPSHPSVSWELNILYCHTNSSGIVPSSFGFDFSTHHSNETTPTKLVDAQWITKSTGHFSLHTYRCLLLHLSHYFKTPLCLLSSLLTPCPPSGSFPGNSFCPSPFLKMLVFCRVVPGPCLPLPSLLGSSVHICDNNCHVLAADSWLTINSD